MSINASLSDIIGAALVTSLFVGVILLFSAGNRKVEEQFGKQSDKLRSKGFEISSRGINVQTQFDVSQDQLVQRASHQAKLAKEKLLNEPGLASFGQQKIN